MIMARVALVVSLGLMATVSYAQPIPNATTDTLILAGISVNGVDKNNIDVLQQDNLINHEITYFIRTDKIAELTGLPLEQPSNDWTITTPLGEAKLSKAFIYSYQNQRYINITDLKKLGITAEFNAADLAINMHVPWNIDKLKSPTAMPEKILPSADYSPEPFGLLGATWHTNANRQTYDNKKTTNNLYSTLGAFGYADAGIWGINTQFSGSHNHDGIAERDNQFFNQTNSKIDNLYWAKPGEKFATRVGINQSGLANNLTNQFTGVSLAYSNKDITRHLSSMSETTQSLLQNTFEDYQHITGTGPAGGIAELRINGQAIARVQIALDKHYEFLNLDVNQWLAPSTIVEVAIFDYPAAKQPIEVRHLKLGKRHSNVATQEMLLETNVGLLGNRLDKQAYQKNTAVGSVYAEYGVSNTLAIRGGFSKMANTAWQTGLNLTTSQQSNLDVNYLHQSDIQELQTDWQYQAKKLYADYQYNQRHYQGYEKNNLINNQNKIDALVDKRHSFYLNYQPNQTTNLSLNQFYNQLANQSDDYAINVLGNHQINPQLNTGFSWDSRGDRYMYRLDWQSLHRPLTVGFLTDNDEYQVSVHHPINNNILLTHTLARPHDDSQLLYGLNMSYQPNDSQLLNLGYNIYNGQHSWDMDWQYYKHNGIRLTVGYRQHDIKNYYDNHRNDSNTTNHLSQNKDSYAYLELTMNWWQPPASKLTWGEYQPHQDGTIVVDVMHPTTPRLDSAQLRFNLDNKEVHASLIHENDAHSQYLITHLKPGIYQLSTDANNIPFEYNTSQLPTPYVKVTRYAPTSVPFKLVKAYGIAGSLANRKANIDITVWQQDKLIQTTKSDETGSFQLLGLTNSVYQLKAHGYHSQTITIDNAFVLGIELQSE